MPPDPFDNRVTVTIHRGILVEIFRECDKFNDHETGGALIGTYRGRSASGLEITVSGVIDAGPRARRTATSFFKDGDYQEQKFREIERWHPEIEHLGNWHTHHVNGYPTLSPGDRATYQKHVNSNQHNTDFWFALLVTELVAPRGYRSKQFILHRGDPKEYEISDDRITVVDRPIMLAETRG
jgi:integrative and conjugative element protein (TIGR02256 family)